MTKRPYASIVDEHISEPAEIEWAYDGRSAVLHFFSDSQVAVTVRMPTKLLKQLHADIAREIRARPDYDGT
jgi:hypothetical protein